MIIIKNLIELFRKEKISNNKDILKKKLGIVIIKFWNKKKKKENFIKKDISKKK